MRFDMIISDLSLQEKFKSNPFVEFWCSSKNEHLQFIVTKGRDIHLQSLIRVKRDLNSCIGKNDTPQKT